MQTTEGFPGSHLRPGWSPLLQSGLTISVCIVVVVSISAQRTWYVAQKPGCWVLQA